jgi:serine/threonine protein kinase
MAIVNFDALPCDADVLLRSLDDRLSEREEEALARHLSDCAACQQRLEQLAAKQDDWSRVSAALRHESSGHAPVSAMEDANDDFSTDFAVDFLEPAVQPHALGRLGEIDILGVLGHGGMGIVLKGFQAELNRPVAVKVLAPHLAASGAARKRFAREAQAAAVIVHPNVMPILTVNSSGRLPFLVMPYVLCESLQQRLDRTGSLATLDVLRIALQTARGLAAAHAQGLVHRDIKPANILLELGVDRVLLTDFGLARAVDDASLTRTGLIAGTPQYMSPEQARGEPLDARSDLFSFGSVLYALCTGRPPFRAETSYGILRRVTDDTPRPIREIAPEHPAWLAAIVNRLLAKQPALRFGSAAEVGDLLEQCLAHYQQPAVVALPPSIAALVEPSSRTGWWSRRNTFAVAALIVAVSVGGIVWNLPETQNTTVDEEVAFTAPQATNPPAQPTTLDSATISTDWNATAVEVETLLQDGHEFARRVESTWDAPTESAPSEDLPSTTSRELESLP